MTRKSFLFILPVGIIALSLVLAISTRDRQQDVRSRAAEPAAGQLIFDPPTQTVAVNGTFPVAVKVNIASGKQLEEVQMNVSYDKTKLTAQSCTAGSGFNGLLGQNPCSINATTGKVTIALEANSANGSTGNITLATITFKGLSGTSQVTVDSGYQLITHDTSTNVSSAYTISVQAGSYTASGSGGGTPTRTPTITRTPTPGGNTPTPTRTPTPGGSTPTRTPTPGGPSPTITPTPGNTSSTNISIGTLSSLTITIGGDSAGSPTPPVPTPTTAPNTPYVRFGVKLFGVAHTPEITVRLKVSDVVVRLTPAPDPADTCVEPRSGEVFFTEIQMVADNSGVYHPKPLGLAHKGSQEIRITQDGWVPLLGLTTGRQYTLYVKGNKHRSEKMATNISLANGKPANQDFDWSGNLLEPGDLPDPNNSNTQDCTINSVDLSLIISRIGQTQQAALTIADINYDGIVNGNDISKVVQTLSTKADDDE